MADSIGSLRPQASAFGTHYDAVAEWIERKLPPLELPTPSETASFALLGIQPRGERSPPRKLPAYLRARTRPPAQAGLSYFNVGRSAHLLDHRLDRSLIQANPFSKSGQRRAMLAARRQRQSMEEPLPLRHVHASESALLATSWSPPRTALARATPSRTSMLVRRLQIARARADPRWERIAQFRQAADGAWSFEQGAWSLGVGKPDPLIAELLDDRLRASSSHGAARAPGAEPAAPLADAGAARAQLLGRIVPSYAQASAARDVLVHNAPPEWLTRAHAELEVEALKDDAAREAAPPPDAEEVAALRRAEALRGGGRPLLSDADLCWRERVRRSGWLQKLLARALAHFDLDGDGSLGFGEYVRFSKQVYAVLHAQYDEAEAERVAVQDWQLDSAGHSRVGAEAWSALWMELAELWTTRVSLREYGAFVLSVLLQIAMAVERRPRAAAHDRAAAAAASGAEAARRRGEEAASMTRLKVAVPQTVAELPMPLDWRRGWREAFPSAEPSALSDPSRLSNPSALSHPSRISNPSAHAPAEGAGGGSARKLQPPSPAALASASATSSGCGASASAIAAGGGTTRARQQRSASAGYGVLHGDGRMVRSWTAIDSFHRPALRR